MLILKYRDYTGQSIWAPQRITKRVFGALLLCGQRAVSMVVV